MGIKGNPSNEGIQVSSLFSGRYDVEDRLQKWGHTYCWPACLLFNEKKCTRSCVSM